MPTDDLHCTARVSHDALLPGFEEVWLKEGYMTSTLMGQMLLWNEKFCLTVTYSDKVERFYGVPGLAPHISLTKTSDMTWAELG